MIEIRNHPVFADQKAIYVNGRLTHYLTQKKVLLSHVNVDANTIAEIEEVIRQELEWEVEKVVERYEHVNE